MVRVPTFVAPSAISGVGLFAATHLPAGTVVWEFHDSVDWRIKPEEFALFPEPHRSRLRHYLYLDESGFFVLCGDNGKFMNHADYPNCDDSNGVQTVTLRDIEAGEELTCDYRQFDVDSMENGMRFKDSALISR